MRESGVCSFRSLVYKTLKSRSNCVRWSARLAHFLSLPALSLSLHVTMARSTTTRPNHTTSQQNSSPGQHEEAVNGEVQSVSPQNNVTGDKEPTSNQKGLKAGVAKTASVDSSRGSANSGQVPATSPERPPPSTHAEKTEATETTIVSSAELQTDTDKDRDKDRGSTSTTLGSTQTQTQSSRPAKRKPEKSPSSSPDKPSKKLAKQKVLPEAPQSSKLSFLSKIFKKFIPCVGPSSIEPLDVGGDTLESDKKVGEKPNAKEAENNKTFKEKDPPPTSEPDLPLPIVPSLIIPPASADPDVILPPTPTKQLLPQSETEGVTSGAVVPPGSTGEPIDHQRSHTVRDSGDESEGTSFTEDDDEGNGMDEAEDEEDRLILNGGAGIPIGPVSDFSAFFFRGWPSLRHVLYCQDGVPRPLLPPLAQSQAGRKCLVLDLDETLVHSSFKVHLLNFYLYILVLIDVFSHYNKLTTLYQSKLSTIGTMCMSSSGQELTTF
jgi:RNA polymerase II subunit A small phosphatase-like protein